MAKNVNVSVCGFAENDREKKGLGRPIQSAGYWERKY